MHTGKALKDFFAYASSSKLVITSNTIRSVVETQTDILYRNGEITEVCSKLKFTETSTHDIL